MPAIFSKNCVLSGEVDCYCLVCCKHLPAEHDVLAHIQDSEHKHNLSAHPYLDKFQQDRIRKVSGVYLCEVCDTTLPTAAKVRLHVTEHTHLDRKRGRMLTRTRKCIVFHENIEITENAWNGLIDDTCVLCNVEFQHDSTHTAEQSHVLNLIKSRVIISADNDVYRHIEDSYQCLTCNMLISDNEMKEHLKCTQHKSALSKHDAYLDDVTEPEPEGECLKDETVHEQDARDNDLVTDSTNKHCDVTSKNAASTDGKTLYTKPVLMKDKQKKACAPSTNKPTDVESLAKQHGLSLMKDDRKVYCNTCNLVVPATIHEIKDHVLRSKHAEKTAKRNEANIEKTSLDNFVKTIAYFEMSNQDTCSVFHKDIYLVFNDTFILKLINLAGIMLSSNRFSCKICNVDLNTLYLVPHITTLQHARAMDSCCVITSLENEFVRQLKENLYDCTYCGHVENNVQAMLNHLDTDEHKKCRQEHDTLLYKARMSGQLITVNLNAFSFTQFF